jgi:hypothetical protein
LKSDRASLLPSAVDSEHPARIECGEHIVAKIPDYEGIDIDESRTVQNEGLGNLCVWHKVSVEVSHPGDEIQQSARIY